MHHIQYILHLLSDLYCYLVCPRIGILHPFSPLHLPQQHFLIAINCYRSTPISSYLISSHPIPSYLISSHLISYHIISSYNTFQLYYAHIALLSAVGALLTNFHYGGTGSRFDPAAPASASSFETANGM